MKKKQKHNFEQLLNWVEGRLSAAETEILAAQLEKTAENDTQALIEWFQEFQRLSQTYRLASPPKELDDQLFAIFARKSEAKQRPHFFQRVLATLAFDSYQQLAVAGVRASGAKAERQLVYGTPLAEITLDLQWSAQEKSVQVDGQLFPLLDETDEAFYVVELQKEAVTLDIVPTDELGKFAFASLTPGMYDLIVSGEQLEIAVTEVNLHF